MIRTVLLRLAAGTAIAAALALPAFAQKKTALVIGLDISDGRNYDPARSADLTPPLTMGATCDTLLTLSTDDLVNVKPSLATTWTLVNNGGAWRFQLRPGVKFWNGDAMTAEDVKFSLDRLVNVKDQPATYASNMGEVKIIDPMTVEIAMKNPKEPLLLDLTAPSFAIYSAKLAKAQGAVSTPGADQSDKATQWLNNNSAGTGPYHMVGWERNVSVTMQKNPHYWGPAPAFERVVVRHIADGAAQLLAVRRGDVDIAMNLSAEQLDSLKGNADVSVIQGASTDTLYFVMTSNPEMNATLAKKEARQAVASAIDYDGLIKGLVGGFADRPPNFLPAGIAGTTLEQTKEFGWKEDLAKSKQLLAAAGVPNGFEFELIYPNAAYFSTSYQLMTQKIQADLARVGIKMNLKPMDNVNWRAQFNGAKSQATIAPWNSPSPNPYLWTGASVQRVAVRMSWKPSQEIVDLVAQGAAENDVAKQKAIYEKYQRILVENANYVTLMQPIYRVAVHKNITNVKLTPNVWKMELAQIKPAS
jgi:peptide/nickel transport system substrate-binding protein